MILACKGKPPQCNLSVMTVWALFLWPPEYSQTAGCPQPPSAEQVAQVGCHPAVTTSRRWTLNLISKSSLNTRGGNRHGKQISCNLPSTALILEGSLHLWCSLTHWQVRPLVLLFILYDVGWAWGHHKLINTVSVIYMSRDFSPWST